MENNPTVAALVLDNNNNNNNNHLLRRESATEVWGSNGTTGGVLDEEDSPHKRSKTQPSGPFSVECSMMDALDALAIPLATLTTSLEASAAARPTADVAKSDETARRMFKLAADRRAKSGGKETHLSIMFQMHGGVELLTAATLVESSTLLAEQQGQGHSGIGISNNNIMISNSTMPAGEIAELYTAAAVALKQCSDRAKRAQGPELIISTIRCFAERAGACARIRAALVNGNGSAAKGAAFNGGGSGSAQIVEAVRLLESSASTVVTIARKGAEEGNSALSRAAAAMSLFCGEALGGRPEQLSALILTTKSSIMKI